MAALVKTKPLSSAAYFLNNKRRTISLAIAIAVSVLTALLFQIMFFAVEESARLSTIGPHEQTSLLIRPEDSDLSDTLLETVKNHESVERLIPISDAYTDYYHFFGNLIVPIYSVSEADIEPAMDAFGLTLVEGRLPEVGKNEIILDELTMKNKKKTLSDYIGHEINADERLPGKYQIVGVVSGDCFIGLSTIKDTIAYEKVVNLVMPKQGEIDSLNRFLESIPENQARVQTRNTELRWYLDNKNLTSVSYNIIAIVILTIMCFAAANASYAQYQARTSEFATLLSMGYTRFYILKKAAYELLFINLIGLVLGLVATILSALLMKAVIFDPNGYPFSFIKLNDALSAFVIPLCTLIASLIPAWWTLSKIDQIQIIDMFE